MCRHCQKCPIMLLPCRWCTQWNGVGRVEHSITGWDLLQNCSFQSIYWLFCSVTSAEFELWESKWAESVNTYDLSRNHAIHSTVKCQVAAAAADIWNYSVAIATFNCQWWQWQWQLTASAWTPFAPKFGVIAFCQWRKTISWFHYWLVDMCGLMQPNIPVWNSML